MILPNRWQSACYRSLTSPEKGPIDPTRTTEVKISFRTTENDPHAVCAVRDKEWLLSMEDRALGAHDPDITLARATDPG